MISTEVLDAENGGGINMLKGTAMDRFLMGLSLGPQHLTCLPGPKKCPSSLCSRERKIV